MTAEVLETPVVAAQAGAPPHPLSEFWSYFRANAGAVAGLVVIVGAGAARAHRRFHRAAFAYR